MLRSFANKFSCYNLNRGFVPGVTYRLTQGVTKRIIPAVASTNATIAAACVTECLKIATASYMHLDNYLMFNNVDGVYTFAFQSERKEDCVACSRCSQELTFSSGSVLQELLDKLGEEGGMNFKAPTLTMRVGGENRTLYVSNLPQLEEQLRPNLGRSFKELEIGDGVEIVVTDPSVRMPVHLKILLPG